MPTTFKQANIGIVLVYGEINGVNVF